MENKIVFDVNGFEVYESSCRLINGNYYYIGDLSIKNSGDVFLINKRYVRIENLVYNYTVNKYTIPSKTIIEGIVSFDKSNNPILGHFEKNMLYNVMLFNEKLEINYCLNKLIIPLCYREELKTGHYFHISKKQASDFNYLYNVSKELKESLPYDSRGITDKFKAKFEKNYNPIITDNVKIYGGLLKDYTFGLEFETIKGVLSEEKLEVLPLIPLRDGSILGLEYVTIPLKGEIGLQSLIDSVEELKSKTLHDTSCALHYHIGGIPRTPEFLLAFYKVSSFFQDEMFSMFPLYKKYNFGVKRKNYSKPFPFNKINSLMDASINIKNKDQINCNFNVLFKYLSEGSDFKQYENDLNNVLEHPKDPKGNQKWNISTRYYSNNLIPIIFGNKQTIEFRIHTPTYDIGKIINFLLFNIYLIDFTIMNLQKILLDPLFLVRIDNFKSFIALYLKNVKLNNSDKQRLSNYHLSYINHRIKQTEIANTLGLIEGDENKIKCSSCIKWNSIDSELNFNRFATLKCFKNDYIQPLNQFLTENIVEETKIASFERVKKHAESLLNNEELMIKSKDLNNLNTSLIFRDNSIDGLIQNPYLKSKNIETIKFYE